MRTRIEKCRRLASAQTDPQVAATLRQMASEIEDDIARISAQGDEPRPMTPTQS